MALYAMASFVFVLINRLLIILVYREVMKKISLLAWITGFGISVTGAPAQATLDYGGLESLFGEPVTTSATGMAQRASDAPANITIISADEIRRSGTRNIPQIIGMYVAGMDVLQDGVNDFEVGVRGYQQPFQPRLLVLIDGRQVFLDHYSRTVWSNLPVNIDDIRQIEVVKGASSALFGSNAGGGVINIVTYSPLYDKNNVATVSAGTQSLFTEDATVTANGKWGGTKFSAGGLDGEEFGTARSTLDQNASSMFNPEHRYFVNSSVFNVTDQLQANTELTVSNSVSNTLDGIGYTTASQKIQTYSARAGFDWNSPYGQITNTNYFNHSGIQFYGANLGTAPVNVTMGMYVSQLQDQFNIGNNHTFRVGAEFRTKETYNDFDLSLVPQDPVLDENIYSLNGTWLWQVNDKLSWTNAVRLDRQQMEENGTLYPGNNFSTADYSHINNTWSANSDINYQATDLDKFRLGYGRGILLPSMVQNGVNLTALYDGIPLDLEGNPTLKPTIVQDVSLDYERKVNPIYSTAKLSTFFEYNQDIIEVTHTPYTTQPVLGIPVYTFLNVGTSQGWGGELELKGSHDGYHWGASYSLAKVVDSGSAEVAPHYEGSAPEHVFHLLGGYTTGSWEIDANAQYQTSTDMLRSPDGGIIQDLVYTGPYLSVGGRVGYDINDHFVLALSGLNINRADTQESPYAAVQRQVFLSLTGRF